MVLFYLRYLEPNSDTNDGDATGTGANSFHPSSVAVDTSCASICILKFRSSGDAGCFIPGKALLNEIRFLIPANCQNYCDRCPANSPDISELVSANIGYRLIRDSCFTGKMSSYR